MNNLLRALIYDNQVSLTLADTTEMVNEGIKRHALSPLSAYVFGKAISAMTFVSACLKEEAGEVSLSIRSDGACGEIAVSGNRGLRMRGYVDQTQLQGKPNAEWEQAALGGDGALTIIRDDGYNRPFVGSCALAQAGGIDASFEEYYRISEQLPTRIQTVVELDANGVCTFAGVAALQPLPFADEETVKAVESVNITALLNDVKSGVQSAAEITFGKPENAVWGTRFAQYKCNCSRRYVSRVIVSLGKEQFEELLRQDGAVKIHCHYCNTDYEYTDEDADKIFPPDL